MRFIPLLALLLTACSVAEAQPQPTPPPLACQLGQVPQVDLSGWSCNGALERIFLPIRAGVAELNLGQIEPGECVTAYAQDGHAALLEEIYSVTASLDPRKQTRYGVMEREGLLVLQGAYAEPGNLVVRLCNLHHEEPADADELLIRWIAIHADHPWP